jgi:shikimate kinase
MQGILLVGMAGSGKSSIGRKVAGLLGFRFIDGDEEIEKKYPDRQAFLDGHGDEAYIRMEETIVLTMPTEDCVLSPGGSMIYSRKCREHLGPCFKVFLDASLETIRARLMDAEKRGVVGLKEKGLEGLYMERVRKYRAYADIVVKAEGKSGEQLAGEIVKVYRKQSSA